MVELLINQIAQDLHKAEITRTPIAPLSETFLLTPEQAYAIQSAWFQLKQPAVLAGHKIGLTALAMQKLLGVDQPDYGFLLKSMLLPGNSVLSRTEFIAPRIEPEIGFWLAEELRGPGLTATDVLAATRGVCASLELVDSRVVDWRIKLVDTIADNASSARVILSSQVLAVQGLDLATEEVTLYCDNKVVGNGNGAAVLGHPATAVAWLANKLSEFDQILYAGQFVLPGAMCAAPFVAAGHTYRANFTHLGEISVSFV
jgi:2-keto-4-pentenoate hydratase